MVFFWIPSSERGWGIWQESGQIFWCRWCFARSGGQIYKLRKCSIIALPLNFKLHWSLSPLVSLILYTRYYCSTCWKIVWFCLQGNYSCKMKWCHEILILCLFREYNVNQSFYWNWMDSSSRSADWNSVFLSLGYFRTYLDRVDVNMFYSCKVNYSLVANVFKRGSICL